MKSFMQACTFKLARNALTGCFASLAVCDALALEPANYKAGPVLIAPTLETKVGYIDNLFREKEDKKNTGVSVVAPRVQTWLEDGLNTYSFTYALVDYRYFESSPDNITDNLFNLDVHYEFNARNEVELYGEYWSFHQPRGVDLSEGIAQFINKPIKLDRTTIGGDYLYGSDSSRGRIKLGARAVDHEYKNFPELTYYHDRNRYEYSSTFMWQVAARTDAVFVGRYITTDYDRLDPADVDGTMDSDENNYLVGITWEATAKTTGSVKVGISDRDYESPERNNDEIFSWEIDVTYALRTYSRFNLASRRYFNETNGLGNALDTEETALTWAHQWNSRSSTELAAMVGSQDYTSSVREDDLYGASAMYTYAFRRWMDFGVGYRFEELDSDLDYYDYTRNEIFLQAKMSL
jgi:polysaccharide biosynthesis protein VpsM